MNEADQQNLLDALASDLEKDASQFANYNREKAYHQRADLVEESIAANRPYQIVQVMSLRHPRIGHPLAACFLGRDAGLQQISECFLNRRDEHSWIFLPEHQLWIDDTTEVGEGSVKGDFLVRTHLMNRFAEVHLFHTHPTQLYLDDIEEQHLDARHLRLAAIPTIPDIFALSYVTECCESIRTIIGHVVSEFGVTSYESTYAEAPEDWKSPHWDWDEFAAELQKGEDTTAALDWGIRRYTELFCFGDDVRWKKVPRWKFRLCTVH